MTCKGDMILKGSLNLNGASATYDGNMSLTSSSGSISLGSLDMSSVGLASISFAMNGTVTGTVANVATNYISGGGTALDPYVTTQARLRVPAGKKLVYHPDATGNNYLDAKCYKVADLSGNAGQGGILKPYTGRGTVITIR
jgi:hypothetical protein